MSDRQESKTRVWWQLMRPHTLTAAVMPVLIGTSLAFADGSFRISLFAAMLAASVLIQAAVNMFNEYFDHRRGLDSIESVGIGGAIVRNELSPSAVFSSAMLFFAAAVCLGIYICIETSWWIAAVGTVSMAAGYFYSAGKRPIAYTAFGEIVSGIFMGPVIVLISYFIQRDTVTVAAILLSVPISMLVAAILLANNIRDAEGDARKGRRTFAIKVGRESAITFLYWMFMTSILWTIVVAASGQATPWVLLVIGVLPLARKAVRLFRSGSTPLEMLPAMKATSRLHSLFGILMSLGLLIGRLAAAR